MSTTAARATLVSPVVPSRRRGVAGTRRAFDPRPVEPARVARVGTTVRAESGSAGSDGAEDLALQWMALNYHPWVKSEADAAKCLNHLREKEGRVFNLDKAKEVLDSVKADHVKFYPNIRSSFRRRTRGSCSSSSAPAIRFRERARRPIINRINTYEFHSHRSTIETDRGPARLRVLVGAHDVVRVRRCILGSRSSGSSVFRAAMARIIGLIVDGMCARCPGVGGGRRAGESLGGL